MSFRDDVKVIADSNNAKAIAFQKKVDEKIAILSKEIYKRAGQGFYDLTINVKNSDMKVFEEVCDILRKEKFSIVSKRVVSKDKEGVFKISWE